MYNKVCCGDCHILQIRIASILTQTNIHIYPKKYLQLHRLLLHIIADRATPLELCYNNTITSSFDCYEFILNRTETWLFAKEDCQQRNKSLVDIHSLEENDFIYNTLKVCFNLQNF